MHAFAPPQVASVVADGDTIIAAVDKAGQSGLVELRYRRRGLFISLGAILFVVVVLGLKLRQIERGAKSAAASRSAGLPPPLA
jgi:hypothetical protein